MRWTARARTAGATPRRRAGAPRASAARADRLAHAIYTEITKQDRTTGLISYAYVAERTPDIRIRVLRWDLSILKMPLRGTLPMAILDLSLGLAGQVSPRPRPSAFRLSPPEDRRHRRRARLLRRHRRDARPVGHVGSTGTEDPHRRPALPESPTDPGTTPRWPSRAMQARALGELARARWRAATGEKLAPSATASRVWPDHPDAGSRRRRRRGIARTQPAFFSGGEARDPGRSGAVDLRASRVGPQVRIFTIETRVFSSPPQRIADAIAALALREEAHAEPDKEIRRRLNPERRRAGSRGGDGLGLERFPRGARHVFPPPAPGRREVWAASAFYLSPSLRAGTPIYVHAKIMIIGRHSAAGRASLPT